MGTLKKKWIHCNQCHGSKKHSQLFSTVKEFFDEDTGYQEVTTHSIFECDGCESLTYHIEYSENGDVSTSQYPPLTIRKEPEWHFDIMLDELGGNSTKSDLLHEIYMALRNNMPRLAVMGVRALLEHVMIDKVGEQGSFAKNLNKFETEGYVSKQAKGVINGVLEAGHASIHRGFKPSVKEVNHLVDITENLLVTLYINEGRMKDMKIHPRSGQ